MKSTLSGDQDYDLWVLLRRTTQVVLKARNRELAAYGISASKASVLFIVQAIGHEATPAEISRYLLREPHSISGLLSRMERQGLVTKVKDVDKKNLVRILLTEKGRRAYYQSTKRETIHNVMSVLSEEERQVLTSCLERIRDKALKEPR
jgi:DNA-binding MarR family transcriptional regulator